MHWKINTVTLNRLNDKIISAKPYIFSFEIVYKASFQLFRFQSVSFCIVTGLYERYNNCLTFIGSAWVSEWLFYSYGKQWGSGCQREISWVLNGTLSIHRLWVLGADLRISPNKEDLVCLCKNCKRVFSSLYYFAHTWRLHKDVTFFYDFRLRYI